MSSVDIPSWITMIAVVIKTVVEIRAKSGTPQTPKDPQSAQAAQRPQTKELNDQAAHNASRWRFVRNNSLSIGMLLIECSYLVWTATRPGPLSGLATVVVAVIVVDLYGTVAFWMLGGNQRVLDRIAEGRGARFVADEE